MLKVEIKAIQEVGLKKTIRFLIYALLGVLYHNLVDHLLAFSYTRKTFLIMLGARFGSNAILMDVRFINWHHLGPKGFKIGKECFIGDGTLIDLYDSVTLKDQVTIAQNVTILTHMNVGYKNHPLQKYFPKFSKGVIFKKGCVIGASSTILPGVIIGEKSFVAAGSVVTKDIPQNTLVVGVPAKKIRKIR